MVIPRRGDVNWPPRSSDLTPLDFFLWGFLKSQVNANKPQSTDALKVNITKTIGQIQPDLCGRVIENWTSRIRATVTSRGGHLNDVISVPYMACMGLSKKIVKTSHIACFIPFYYLPALIEESVTIKIWHCANLLRHQQVSDDER